MNKFRNNKFAASMVIPTYICHLSGAGIDKKRKYIASAATVLFSCLVLFRSVVLKLSLMSSSAIQLLPVGGLEMLIFNL